MYILFTIRVKILFLLRDLYESLNRVIESRITSKL